MLKVTGATAALVSVAADLPFYFQNPLSSRHLAREVGLWNAKSVLGHQNRQQADDLRLKVQHYSLSMRSAPRQHGWWAPFP